VKIIKGIYIMNKDIKEVLKALGVYKEAKLKSFKKHAKFICPQISVPVILPFKINNPKVYIKKYEKLKIS